MSEDPSFAEEVKTAGKRIAEAEKDPEDKEILIRTGKELGYEFTVGDVERSFADDQELDGGELRNIAGGMLNDNACNIECYGWFMNYIRS